MLWPAWRCASIVVTALSIAACSKSAVPSAAVSEGGPRYEVRDSWVGSPCLPRGDEIAVTGRIEVKPFGKGSDGARLVVDGGESWVISYRAEGPILQLSGKRVRATGRACDKQLEAIAGKHFDVVTLEALPEL